MTNGATDEATTPEPDGFKALLKAEISGGVTHHPPCVPECPVCYPKTSET